MLSQSQNRFPLTIQKKITDSYRSQSKKTNLPSQLADPIGFAAMQIAKKFPEEIGNDTDSQRSQDESVSDLVEQITTLIIGNESAESLRKLIEDKINDFPLSSVTPKKSQSGEKIRIRGMTSGTSEDHCDTDSELSFASPSPSSSSSTSSRGRYNSDSFSPKTPGFKFKFYNSSSEISADSPASPSQRRRGESSGFYPNDSGSRDSAILSPFSVSKIKNSINEGDVSFDSPMDDRSRSDSSGRYPNDSGSRDSALMSPIRLRTRSSSSSSPDLLSPLRKGLAFANGVNYSPQKFAQVAQTLNKEFSKLTPHQTESAIQFYVEIAKTHFKKLKANHESTNLTNEKKSQSCQTILQCLFTAFPDINRSGNQASEQKEIHAILVYCYQFLFFESSNVAKAKHPENIFDLFGDQQYLNQLKKEALNEFSLLPYLAYVYLQFKLNELDGILEHFEIDVPQIIFAILRQDVEQERKAEEIPWRTKLLNAFFQLNSAFAIDCLPLCIQAREKKYVEHLLKEAAMTLEDIFVQLIIQGKLRDVVKCAYSFNFDQQILISCFETALTAFQMPELEKDMGDLGIFITSLLQAVNQYQKNNQIIQDEFDSEALIGILIKKNKWDELVDWLQFANIEEAGFELVDNKQKYFLQAVLASKLNIAEKMKEKFELKVDLKNICTIPSATYTSQQWLEILLYVLDSEKKQCNAKKTSLQTNGALTKSSSQDAVKLNLLTRLYSHLHALLDGIKKNPNFPVNTIQFAEDELTALSEAKGAFKLFCDKLKETQAAPQALKYLLQDAGTTFHGVKRGESNKKMRKGKSDS